MIADDKQLNLLEQQAILVKIKEILADTIELSKSFIIDNPIAFEETHSINLFNKKGKNTIFSLNFFLKIWQQTKLEHAYYIYSLMLVDKLISLNKIELTYQNAENIYFTCLVLSIKTLSDKNKGNRRYAEMAGIKLNQLNKMEYKILSLLDFEVYLSEELFLSYEKYLFGLIDNNMK